jgi:hypothetical protein
MTEAAWGWSLFGAESLGLIASLVLIGRLRLWWGWLILAAMISAPWLAYGISTGRAGFMALASLGLAVNLTNAIRWKADPES